MGDLDKINSSRWLENFANKYGTSYHRMMTDLVNGETICFGDDDAPEIANSNEFWYHIGNVLGEDFVEKNRDTAYFCCAC